MIMLKIGNKELVMRISRRAVSRALRAAIVIALAAAALSLVATLYGYRHILRDMAVAIIADRRAGEPMPLDWGADYIESRLVERWGMLSNSEYILSRARHYLPFFVYENLTPEPAIPPLIAFMPAKDERSFHLLGQAACMTSGTILLNERFTYDRRYNDARKLDATLVHEMIHDQGGAFCSGRSEDLESATEAATLEILAASCNYGDRVSCGAFWLNVRDFALGSLRAYAIEYRAEDWYQRFVNAFIRDGDERAWADKALRWWNGDPDRRATLEQIILKYAASPWRRRVIPAVLFNTPMATGTYAYVYETFAGVPGFARREGALAFDDTRILLNVIVRVLWIATPYVGW